MAGKMAAKKETLKYQDIKRRLDKKEIANCYLFTGEEVFLKDKIIKSLKKLLINEALEDFNFNDISTSEEFNISEILGIAGTLPLSIGVSENKIRRLVVLKDIDDLVENDREALASYVSKPVDTTCLVLTAEKLDLRKKYNNELVSNSTHAHFYRLYDNAVSQWLKDEASNNKKSISADAVQCLIEETGNDLYGLANEMAKLTAFIGEREKIEMSDIRQVMCYVKDNTAFDLQKAITYKDTENALRILKSILDENSYGSMMALSTIALRLKQIALTKIMLKQGMQEKDIFQSLKGLNQFYNNYLIKEAVNFSDRELTEGFSSLLKADIEIKKGRKPPRLTLETLILNLCGNKPAVAVR
jgi:DNA polymerase-3 subunit delta